MGNRQQKIFYPVWIPCFNENIQDIEMFYCRGWKFSLVFIFVVFVGKKRKTKIKTDEYVFVSSRRFCEWKNRVKTPNTCWDIGANFKESLLHHLRLSHSHLMSCICLSSQLKFLHHGYIEYIPNCYRFWAKMWLSVVW